MNDQDFIDNTSTPEEDMLQMNAMIPSAAEALATAHMDVLAYGCTTGSFFKGPGWDDEMTAIMEKAAGVPAVGTSPSVVKALRHVNAKRIAIATPYPDWNNEKLRPCTCRSFSSSSSSFTAPLCHAAQIRQRLLFENLCCSPVFCHVTYTAALEMLQTWSRWALRLSFSRATRRRLARATKASTISA